MPYASDAPKPHIEARTMEIRRRKHQTAYVDKLNDALASHPQLQRESIEDLIRNLTSLSDSGRTAVRNDGGGHLNHTIFWNNVSPNGGGAPDG